MLRITKQTFLLAGITALLAACGTTAEPSASAPHLSAQGNTTSTTNIKMTTAETAGSFGAWATGSFGVWAAGSFGAWASGSFGAWASGSFGVWATTFEDGTPNPLHNNVEEWNQIRLAGAHTLAPNLGKDVTVAVIDTGIDLAHPALSGTLSPESTWWDYVSGDRNPGEMGTASDKAYGHGTAVAGIILQVAPNARILPIRVLPPSGEGTSTTIAKAIIHAVDQGAKVVNVSVVADKDSDISKAIEYAALRGVYVVMAAGNQGLNPVQFPAAKSAQTNTPGLYSLSVGGIELNNRKSSYSNYGAGLEVMTPASDIVTTYPKGEIRAVTGTSFATPVASGVLALALGEGYSADNAGELTEKLKLSEQNVDIENHDLVLLMEKKALGFGLLNAEAFLKSIK
ncbi:S8 family serine peptidase [Deinococcus deserti]|uniref:Putative peptidase S8, subtilase family n=1 Tax=Deinococcus deserti (strain DSM 17065 / CIP 109153 / LMG 22923 / VCD115) TaxID=546414 RepID=C1D268_DEIDV|nr:S8 family serine peptidase [Deinococcus deserti]ACO47507.1 putative peptidase S8, precursor, subtilase family [Deinococcus deserti VCD115]